MRRDKRRPAWGPVAGLLGLAFAFILLARPGQAQTTNLTFNRTSLPGFGDRQNSYSWSMRWFRGKLYVGTNRNFANVERTTTLYYFPELAPFLLLDPGIPDFPDPYDMDLRAEIWCYDPAPRTWTRVYQSPVIDNPRAPGKTIARDIGYRDLVVFNESDGSQCLYAVGTTSREYIPELPPPRILRTRDGINFTPVPQDPGTLLGDFNAITFRATAVYKRKFYVTASPGLTGDGMLYEAARPSQGNNAFRPVTDPELKVYEMAVFNNQLYIGAGSQEDGYAVYRTDATGTPPYKLTPIVTGGAGRGAGMASVVSMFPFQGKLYVGSAGWFPNPAPTSELIRINPDDSWEVVVGNPRQTDQGFKFPISGLPDGFGNPFNAHVWRLQEHGGLLYAGTNDSSWSLRTIPWLDPYIRPQYGFDLFTSPDGVNWTLQSRNGFGNMFNFGLRTFASTAYGLFVGTVNYVTGTEVWLGTPSTLGGATGLAGRSGPSGGRADRLAVAPPAAVEADSVGEGAGTLLSWSPSERAERYHVFRSTERGVGAAATAELVGRLAGPGGNPAFLDGVDGPESELRVPGRFTRVGVTAQPYFRDDSAPRGASPTYYVVAEDRGGRRSIASNITAGLPAAPVANFGRARDLIAGWAGADGPRGELAARLGATLDRARLSAEAGDLPAALEGLAELRRQATPAAEGVLDRAESEQLARMVDRLERRVELVRRGALKRAALIGSD